MPAFEVAPTSPIVRTLNRSYLRVHGRAQRTGVIKPFYGTDADHLFAKAGMEGVVCGPAAATTRCRASGSISPYYLDMIRIYLLTILEICEQA